MKSNITDIGKAKKTDGRDAVARVCKDLWERQHQVPFNPEFRGLRELIASAAGFVRTRGHRTAPAGLNRRDRQRWHHLNAVEQAGARLAGQHACADGMASMAVQAALELAVPHRMRTCVGYLRHGRRNGCFVEGMKEVPAGAAVSADALLSRHMILNYSAAVRLRGLCQPGLEHIRTMLFRAVAAAVYLDSDILGPGEKDTLFTDTLSETAAQRIMLAPELLRQLGVRDRVLPSDRKTAVLPIWDIRLTDESPPCPEAGRLDILVPDTFMRRVDADTHWSMFNAAQAEHLHDLTGETFAEAYGELEEHGRSLPLATEKARVIWVRASRWAADRDNVRIRFIEASRRLGSPDSQAAEKAAVPAGAVNAAMHTLDGPVNDESLAKSTQILTRALDRILDITEIERHDGRRPLAISVAGLGDVCFTQGISYRHPMAAELHTRIRAIVANAAAETSSQLAEVLGSFHQFDTGGSSRHWWAEGKLPQDRHRESLRRLGPVAVAEQDLFEQPLRERVMRGMRNNQLCADRVEEFQHLGFYGDVFGTPDYADPYPRAVWAGAHPDSGEPLRRVNPWLIQALDPHGAWGPEMLEAVEVCGGSVMSLQTLPENMRMLMLGGAEIPVGTLIDLAAASQPYVTGPVEFTIHVPETDERGIDHLHISQMFFRAWALGLQQAPRCITAGVHAAYVTETGKARAAES